MQENSINFTEEINAIDYLDKARYFLALVKQDPINWKWVILALHGALYGFAICALRGAHNDLVYRGINIGSQKKRFKSNFWQYWRLLTGIFFQKKKPKKRVLESLDGAIRKCQNSEIMSELGNGQPLVLTTSQKVSVNKMTRELRNSFVHYIPKVWSIPTKHLPHISNDVLDVISFLATKTDTNPHVAKNRHKIEVLIRDCKAVLKEINQDNRSTAHRSP